VLTDTKMKKLILLASVLLVLNTAKAQYRSNDNQKFFLSGGFDLGLPSNSPFGVSYGGSLKAEIPIVMPISLTLTGGYDAYSYKGSFLNFSGLQTNLHPAFIPLKAGIKYFTGPGFYAEGELGTAIQANYGSDSMFAYSVGLGFEVPVDTHSDIDIGFRYEGYSENEYQITAIRVAYRVGW
jgi:opacity protein-like surface antigen